MTATPLRIGMIGLDTSHCTTFASMLNDPAHRCHVPGGTVTVAYAGGSPDFDLSWSRVPGIAAELQDRFGIRLLDTPEEVAASCDAILLTAVDGRSHRELIAAIAPYGKPVYVDKPFALQAEDALEMIRLSEQYGMPMFTCSAVRYGPPLRLVLDNEPSGGWFGADISGPMSLEPTQNGLFWYGIHTVEVLFAVMGPGCKQVSAVSTEQHEWVTGLWEDGRIGTVRGNRAGCPKFHALLHRPEGAVSVDILGQQSSEAYQQLLIDFLHMAEGGAAPVLLSLSLEIVRFLESANASRQNAGQWIPL
ncbi:Gfo/Idh/MocA family protein [Paenibacillus koleovorans]|uniref:Gfo/Idh/MocA family protein n=1 Tax=Paenibacillus koleovorans TaxID=121608 RepID=UPI000FD81C78|nr:Gfo/Idh/MocA family oxidoreductase [Paenibacillus koleovorans]